MRLVYTDILFYSILVYLIENDLRRGRYVVFNLHVQLLFVAKYRRTVFTKQVLDDLEVIFADVCNKLEAELVAFDGEDDYVHLLVNYPPVYRTAKYATLNSFLCASITT